METSGLFIQRLKELQKICDLEKFLNLKTPGSPVHYQESYTHWVTSAAVSYWRCDKSPLKAWAAKNPTIAMKTLPPLRLR